MNNKNVFISLILLSLFLCAGMLSAQQTGEGSEHAEADAPARSGLSGSLYRIEYMLIMPVVAMEGVREQTMPPAQHSGTIAAEGLGTPAPETLGTVRDVVLSLDGRVSHLLVDISGFEETEMGMFLVQRGEFSINDRGIVILQTQEELRRVENEDALATAGGNVLSGRQLLGYEVIGTGGESFGEIEDAVVDMEAGRIVYVALSRGGVLGIGEDLFALPFQALSIDKQEEQVRVDVTEEYFQEREGFSATEWPEDAGEVPPQQE